MSEGTKGKLGERELDIMQVLWKLGSGTVTEVHYALLKQEKLIAYTTVQTVMNRLEEKGHLRRDASERAHRFTPILKEPTTIRAGLQRLADRFFGGSMEGVTAHLVERNLTPKQLERIESLINKHRRKA